MDSDDLDHRSRIKALEERVKALEVDSHPSVDIVERIMQAINSGELKLRGNSHEGIVHINTATVWKV